MVTVNDADPRASSLWSIARHNLAFILSTDEQVRLAIQGGTVAVERTATVRLGDANGFDMALMDGRITQEKGDPDRLVDGWKINVNVLHA